MKVVVASSICIIVALVGLEVFRLWLARDAKELAAQAWQTAADRLMEERRQKVRDWLAAAEELRKTSELLRRQSQHRQQTALFWLPSVSEIELRVENRPRRVSSFSLEPCTLWQRQMKKLRVELGLPPLPAWN